jgi:hypothetical protein
MNTFYDNVLQCLSKHSADAAAKMQAHFSPSADVPNPVITTNNYLRVQLGMLPCSTVNERECLMDDVTEKDWLRLFNKHVAPTIAAYGLPSWK